MTTGRINQVTWWRNRCGRGQPNPTERTTKFAVVAILQLHLNISSPIRRMIHALMKYFHPEGRSHQHEKLLGLMTMTNNRCFRIDLTLNRFVASTKCNSTKILSAVTARREPRPPDCATSHRRFRSMMKPQQSSRYQDRILDHTRAGRRCFQISSSRGLTPLGSAETWVLAISM